MYNLKSLIYNKDFQKYDNLHKLVNGREFIFVPREMQFELIEHAHEKTDFTAAKTEDIIKQEFCTTYIYLKMSESVIINCFYCILTNSKCLKKEAILNLISKEYIPLSKYHGDFIGRLFSTKRNISTCLR